VGLHENQFYRMLTVTSAVVVTRTRTKRPARLPGEERRQHFLQVAADLITDKGVDAVTMESVASAAGVSKGLGYAYFTNRNDLLLAVLEGELDAFNRRIVDAVRAADPAFEDRVRAAVHAWFDALVERGALLSTLLQASQVRQPLRERRNSTYRQLEEYWGHLAAAEFGVPEKKAVAAAAVLIAGMQGLLDRWVLARDNRQELEDAYVAFAIGGLRALG
jgi:AcrR family transcriptional regulator